MNKVSSVLFAAVCLFLFCAGCEQTFQPLDKTDDVFTIYGVLDVHSDTQWVRVMPIGETYLPQDPSIGSSEVRLTREATGETVTLNDSLFKFSGDTYVWNYWLPDSVFTNEVYTLVAENEEGEQSRVTLETPSPLELPEVEKRGGETRISGPAADSLVVASVNYLVQPVTDMGCGQEVEISVSQLDHTLLNSEGGYFFIVRGSSAIVDELGTSNFIVNRTSVEVVTATDSWPDATSLEDIEVALPEVVSNVENGTGVLAGVARREVILTPRQPPCKNEK
ncbi:hypothetical protein [Gracilimonas sediminicola]|uniref:DUF4249 domain-containing protein n=1 Tax=Gracilimonas sediminicola TaxID=2952158 RepID=A0A9X2L3N2_9BACT|nr:hypothetical protein [Gracilimonas sediminicola]MCP9291699.1 hypothetical protein [Gracilimonas sediminicola]